MKVPASVLNSFQSYLWVSASDPVRKVLNQAIAVVLAFMTPFVVLNDVLFPTMHLLTLGALVAVPLLWWRNRYGGIESGILLCVYFAFLTSFGTNPFDYMVGQVSVPIEYALSILLAGLFIRPAAAWGMLLVQLAGIAWASHTAGVGWDTIAVYMQVALITLGFVAVISSIAATVFTRAIRTATQQAERADAANMQLERTNAGLEHTVAERTHQLRAVMDAREEEVTTVIHDLGYESGRMITIINMTLAQVEMDGTAPATVIQTAWRNLHIAQQNYQRLVTNLSDAVRMQHHVLELNPEAFPLDVLLDDVVMAVRLQEADEVQPGTMCIATEPALPWVWIDRDRMRRIFHNVLGNALKYSRDGLGGPQIALGVTSTPTHVVVTITDNGNGIAPEQLQRIGERFHQVAQNRTGMGVGLSFCIRIMQQSGGSVRIDSPGEQQGTTVTLFLPRADQPRS